MKLEDKRVIEEKVKGKDFYFDIEMFESTLDHLIEWLVSVKEEAKEFGYYELFVSYRSGNRIFDEEASIELWGKRRETDKEVKKRIAQVRKERKRNKEIREKRKGKEYKEYLRLKEKFKIND